MTAPRPRGRPRKVDPDADLLAEAELITPPIMPMCEESTHELLMRRRRAAAERDARLRTMRRAWRLE